MEQMQFKILKIDLEKYVNSIKTQLSNLVVEFFVLNKFDFLRVDKITINYLKNTACQLEFNF